MKQTRILSLLLALVLCLGLLPVTAMAEEPIRVVFYEDLSGGQDYANLAVNAEGKLDSFPTPPVRAGYTFLGWVETQDGPVIDENHVFAADTKLFGTWSADTLYTNLDPNGGTCAKNKVALKEKGTAYVLAEDLPTPTREGYTFLGWFRYAEDDTPVKNDGYFAPNETLTARWTKTGMAEVGPREVWFHLNGGTVVSVAGARPSAPGEDILYQGNAIYWERSDDGEEILGEMFTDEYGQLIALPVIEREGYKFDGWYTAETGGTKVSASTVFTGSGKYGRDYLWARWTSANPNGPYTVKFDLNYKDAKQSEKPKDQTVAKGQSVSLPDGSKLTPPSDAYEFYAWGIMGKDDKGEDVLYPWNESQAVTTDMTLYAGWVRKGSAIVNGEAIDAKVDTTAKPSTTTPATPAPTPAKTSFTDVAATSAFAPAIGWAVEKGITNGTTPTTFEPGKTCTRAQIVTFLWRAAGSPEPKSMEAEYADVTNTTAYFYKAVQWAAEMGMEESGTFKPGDPCTRGQAVYFIWKANDSGASAGSAPSFTDLPKDSLYYDAVLWAVGQGVTNGTGDGTTFSPDATCTRGQIVTFLYRAYEN